MMRRCQSFFFHLGVGAFFLAVAIAFTWPLAVELDRAVSDPGDPFLNAWILDWVQYALIHGFNLWNAPVFHPAVMTLALSENMILQAILLLPFRMGGAGPLEVHNLAMLLGLTLTGYGGFVLARAAGATILGSLAGGLFFCFVPYRFDHLAHVQHMWAGFLALLLAAALAYIQRPRPAIAFAMGLAFVANGLTNLHNFVFGSVATAMVLMLGVLFAGRTRRWQTWVPAIAALVVASAALLPMVDAYSTASELHGLRRGWAEVKFFSATWEDWLVPPLNTKWYAAMATRPLRFPERALFPGLLGLVLAGLGLMNAMKLRPDEHTHTHTHT